MSRAQKTVRGIAWAVAANLGARGVGLVGTLLLARYLDPADYGEVMAASVVASTAQSFSNLGLGQYLLVKPQADDRVIFHVTFYSAILCSGALLIWLALGPSIGPIFRVTQIMRYLPLLSVVALLDRISSVPERLLHRDLRFKLVGLNNAFGDFAYTAVSLALVTRTGGMSIVWGNVARSSLRAAVIFKVNGRRGWLDPVPIRRDITRQIFGFGLRLALGNWAGFLARRWDNMLTSRYFGPAVMGAYNYAYNLANVPALQVGEQIGDVLLPSFGHLEGQQKRNAFLRSTRMMALLDFPLAVGLGAIAPTLVIVVLNAQWHTVGPMLVILSSLSLAYPLGYTAGCYLQAAERPMLLSYLEIGKALLLFGGIILLGPLGPLWVCVAVAAAYSLHALASLWMVQVADGVPFLSSLGGLGPPLAACLPLVLAVLAVRFGLHRHDPLGLAFEVLAGIVGYVAGAFLFARSLTRDFLELAHRFLRRDPRPDDGPNPTQAKPGP
ncbi:MAG TPA: oligosaccharide flippase family protein [Polyangia bacterium]|nr:oligosaccharide flippase family protein [Polyangia bacterium]